MKFKVRSLSAIITAATLLVASFVQVSPASAAGLCDYSKPRSATQNGEVFLGGKYIQLGISELGDFGTRGDAPRCFVPRHNGSGIGMVTDIDGFGQGEDIAMDYFLPGSPEERFGFGAVLDDTSSMSISQSMLENGNNAVLPSTGDIDANTAFVKGHTTVTDTSSGSVLSATVVTHYLLADGVTPLAELTQNISFSVNDRFFVNTVTIKNESTHDFTSTKYYRNFDPDNTVDIGGDYTTQNEILSTIASDGRAIVRAQTRHTENYGSVTTRAPIMLYSADPDAAPGYGGFSNTDVFSLPTDGQNKGDSLIDDIAIFMSFDKGALAAGSSVSLKYATNLDSRHFSELNDVLSLALGVPANLMVSDAYVNHITATTADVNYTATKDSTGYVLVQPSADPAPTASDVVTNGASASILKGVNTAAVTGLTDGVAYKAYIVAQSGAETTSLLVSPEFIASTPPAVSGVSISSISQSAADFNFSMSQVGSMHYVVQEAALAAPSLDRVLTENNWVITSTDTNTIGLNSLQPLVDYKVYYVAQNGSGNVSALGSVAFKTLPYTYTITYHYDDAGAAAKYAATSTWKTGQPAVKLPRPSRYGYSFVAWYSDAGLTSLVSSPATPTGDTDLYAKWVESAAPVATPVAVTFSANDSSTPATVDQFASGSATLNPNTFTRRGYTFAGWNTKADGTGVAYADKATFVFTDGATLYATWQLAPFKKSVSNFATGSSALTDATKAAIVVWAAELPDAKTLKCVGIYTKANATAAEKKTALDRAVAVCAYAKSLRPDITTVTSTWGSLAKRAYTKIVSAKLG